MDEKLDWFIMEGRNNTEILWDAICYIRESDPETARFLNQVRNGLIDSNGQTTMFLYRTKN